MIYALVAYQNGETNKAEVHLRLKEKLKFVTNFTELEDFIEKSAAEVHGSTVKTALDFVRETAIEIGTNAAVSYLVKLISDGNLQDHLKIRFYTHLAFAKSPTQAELVQLAKFLKNESLNLQSHKENSFACKSFRALVLGASAYAYQFCRKSSDCSEKSEYSNLVNEIANILSQPNQKSHITPALLQGLGNLPHLTSQAITIIKDILTKEEAGAHDDVRQLTAFQAFRRDPCQSTLKQVTRDILQSSNHTTETRIEAYVALTRCVQEDDVAAIENIVRMETSSSLSSFIASHMFNTRSSQSPSKFFIQDSPLSRISVPTNVTTVHNISEASKYVEFSLFRPQQNLGFSVDGYVIFQYQGLSPKPRFMLVNMTLDILGKSYNNLQVGFSDRYGPEIKRMSYRREEPNLIRSMLNSFKAVDSFYRIHGTTVAMGNDILDTISPNVQGFADLDEGGKVDFRKACELLNHEIVIPTLSGLPLTINPQLVTFPMLKAIFKNDHSEVNLEYSLLAGLDISLGKGTPVHVRHNMMLKTHSTYALNYELMEKMGFAVTSEWKVRLPEKVVWSERLTASREIFMETGEPLLIRPSNVVEHVYPQR